MLRYLAGPAGERALDRAAALLLAGRLVAFPTETVYGLGALGLDPAAVARLFAAKGRPKTHPLILHVTGEDQARALALLWPPAAAKLAAAFWPGPLTLVVPKAPGVPDEVTAGLGSVAVRAPSHPVARLLLARVAAPLAAPSANRYTAISPTSAAHVAKSLGDRIDAVLDAGQTPLGIESAVVDVTGRPRLLRPGVIERGEIEAVVGELELGPGAVPEGQARLSPGLAQRHYAPAVPARLVSPGEADAAAGAGVLALHPRPAGSGSFAWIQLPAEPRGYARALYGALHALEDAGAPTIRIERPPEEAGWEAVLDRLRRATGAP